MLPELASVLHFIKDPPVSIELIGGLIAFFVGLAKLLPNLRRKWQSYQDRKSLRRRLGAELYTAEEILLATRNYIKPNCQDVDPNQEEEIRSVHGVQADLFATVDNLLMNPSKYKYVIIMADSGMGKTAFLMNYYARCNRISMKKRRFRIALVPLGIKNADNYIERIKDKANTVLFLDAFDEDTRAIQDHKSRLSQLIENGREFRQVVITSRTQFFPRAEEIPQETGVLKVGVTRAGDSHVYLFYKLYLSPFNNLQVEQYLKKQFSIWNMTERRLAQAMVRKIPLLAVRPMLLTHIKDLVQTGRHYNYSFQLYEEMVQAWIKREQPFVVNSKALLDFSEMLALDLYVNRAHRGAERVHYSELIPLAHSYGIDLQEWQLRSRSLLNRDASGYYKFAHRSIMEFLFVKRFLKTAPELRPKTEWTDQMSQFLMEILLLHQEKGLEFPDLTHIDRKCMPHSKWLFSLRSNSQRLTDADARKMLVRLGFYDSRLNEKGKGMQHLFYNNGKSENGTIMDFASGLMWQRKGSAEPMKYQSAREWIEELNWIGYSGYHDWRLPTLEEAMSLMEPTQTRRLFHINPVFDLKHKRIWTTDSLPDGSRCWIVDYDNGICYDDEVRTSVFVRAVR